MAFLGYYAGVGGRSKEADSSSWVCGKARVAMRETMRTKAKVGVSMRMEEDLSSFVTVPVVDVVEVGTKRNLLSVVVNMRGDYGMFLEHRLPGQWVEVRGPRGRCGKLVIASTPGNSGMVFEFLCDVDENTADMATAQVGDYVRIGRVSGSGFAPARNSKIFFFADGANGIAAARSYVEYGRYSFLSRGTEVSLFIPAKNDAEGLQSLVTGVDIQPISGRDVTHAFWQSGKLRWKGSLTDISVALHVERDDTASTIEGIMKRLSVQDDDIQLRTTEAMLGVPAVFQDLQSSPEDFEFQSAPFSGSIDYQEDGEDLEYEFEDQEELEKEVWKMWSSFRETMREEFETKRSQSATISGSNGSESWDEWLRQNGEKWREIKWEDSVWERYWDVWEEDQEKWVGPGFVEGVTTNFINFGFTGSRYQGGFDWGSSGPRGEGKSGHNQSRRAKWQQEQGSSSQVFERGLDFYNILGVQRSADYREIKQAYRMMAKKFHPDRNRSNEAEASEKMKTIVLAYSVLKDRRKRSKYDQFGVAGI